MDLKVGDRLQLEPKFMLGHERFTVKVIGYIKGVSIIVTAPIGANGLRLALQEKDKAIVRSFSGKNVFAFSCDILRIINFGVEYFHLSIPDTIQGIKLRKVPRIKSNIITTVLNTMHEGMEQQSAIISDICPNGASLQSKLPLGANGDILRFAFRVHVHNIEAILSVVDGIIRTSTQDDETIQNKFGSYHYGIEFHDLQVNDSVILQSMIYQQMVENPHGIL